MQDACVCMRIICSLWKLKLFTNFQLGHWTWEQQTSEVESQHGLHLDSQGRLSVGCTDHREMPPFDTSDHSPGCVSSWRQLGGDILQKLHETRESLVE